MRANRAIRRGASCLCACFVLLGAAHATEPPSCEGCITDSLTNDDDTKTYNFSVQANTRYDILLFRTSGTGDADLYSKDASDISTTSYDCAPQLAGDKYEKCSFETSTTTWTHYLLVHAYDGPVSYEVHMVESDAGCHSGSNGNSTYCSSSCTCGWEFGDCDSDAECGAGLTCVDNVGADYGFASTVDICRGG